MILPQCGSTEIPPPCTTLVELTKATATPDKQLDQILESLHSVYPMPVVEGTARCLIPHKQCHKFVTYLLVTKSFCILRSGELYSHSRFGDGNL
jgi:hypothetical protein